MRAASGSPEGEDTGEEIDWGEEAEEPLACGIENPETCESCQ